MLIILGNILITVILLVAWPFLALWAIIGRHSLTDRLGFLPKSDGPIWIHAASVGEAGVAGVTRDIVRRICPDVPVLMTATTRMGLSRLRKLTGPGERAAILPLDHPLFVKIAFDRVTPKALILVETEFWPNLMIAAKKRGIPVILVNGRISESTLKWVRIFPKTFRGFTKRIDRFLMKSGFDAENLLKTGVSHEKVEVLGNLKFAGLPMITEKIVLHRSPVIVFGSVRVKEFRQVIRAGKSILSEFPEALLIYAPRHLNTVVELNKSLEAAGINIALRSKANDPENAQAYVIDTMGELLGFYASANVAFIGGTLADYGGHNPLEPAFYSIPVLFGPFIDANREAFDALGNVGGGIEIADEKQLADSIIDLLYNPEKRDKIGRAARSSTDRMAHLPEEYEVRLREYIAL